MQKTLTVHNSAAAVLAVPAGHELIASMRRSTKERKVSEADKYRAIVIPELSLAESGVPGKFQSIVLDALRGTAEKQLAALWADATDSFTSCPGDCWTVDALLAYAERVSVSQRLTKDTIEAWFDGSDLAKRAATKGAAVVKKFKDAFAGLAGSVLGLSEVQCTALLSHLAKEADCWQVEAMNRKLARRLEELAKLEDLADLDDLGV